MDKLKHSLSWLNNNLLFILSAFLIAFIPLFPKIPIFDILPGYIVRVRAEDFLIFITALVWLRDAYQKKFHWKTAFFWIVLAYAAVGLVSILLGTVLSHSIPAELLHVGKSGLHFFRYMEYFALFFFLYSAINTKQHIKIILVTLVITLIGIVGYGFGQQYLRFPLYSTMNREFSKGQKLYLQENARPQSTFAGHYDLGAYLVLVLPLIFALSIFKLNDPKTKRDKRKNTALKIFLHTTHLFGAWMLVTSGSKTALAAYLTGIFIVMIFYLKRLGNLRQQIMWGSFAFVIFTVGFGIFITVFGQETRTMLTSIAQRNTTINKVITKIPGFEDQSVVIDNTRPDDLYGEGHDTKIVTKIDKEGNEYTEIEYVESTWSQNALKYGLSMGIRLDTLWPQAIKGLINNPLFGNGYGTLSRTVEGQYTEADSTDNNFLRTLGETGALGFITFYGLIIFILIIVFKNTKNLDPLVAAINIGFTGSIIGLLINATYIDVFAASKVAFSFWALAGVIIKSGKVISGKNKQSTNMSTENRFTKKLNTHFKNNWPIYISFLLAFFVLHRNPFVHSEIRSFNTSNHAVEGVTAAKCFINHGTFSVCRNDGTILKENLNLYSILLIPYLKINLNPGMFYFLNFTIFLLLLFTARKIAIKQELSTTNQFIVLLSVVATSSIFQITHAPLSTTTIFLYIGISIAISVLITFGLKLANKKHLKTLQVVLLSILVLATFKTTNINDIGNYFRNTEDTNRYRTYKRANKKFSDRYVITNQNIKSYLITADNPYYVDLQSNDNYLLLPFSKHQDYFNQVEQTWGDYDYSDLNQIYTDLLDEGKEIFLADYGIKNTREYTGRLDDIKQSFDLRYHIIDCEDSCNIMTLEPRSEIVSDIPESINQNIFKVADISDNFKFRIISNRFDSKDYNTDLFAEKLSSLDDSDIDFSIFTGDIIDKPEQYLQSALSLGYTGKTNQPIIYNSGNQDLITNKLYSSKDRAFFDGDNYFIIFSPDAESKIDINQRLFVYNALLEVEQLPQIKNVFVISHDLDWQNKETEDNFIIELDKKLAELENVNKIIITADHDREGNFKNQLDMNNNILYLSSLFNNSPIDNYIDIEISKSEHPKINTDIQYSLKQLSQD